MKFTRNSGYEDFLLEGMWKAMEEPDRVQPSVTGMIKCLTKTFYENYYTTGGGKAPDRGTLLLFGTGLALEHVMLNDMQRTEGGIFEGIAYHMDHFGSETDFIEFKSTRLSTKSAPENYSLQWKRQWMAYAKVKGITSGRFVALHLMGNYAPPFPDLVAWDVECSAEEIDLNWQWMELRRDTYLEHVAAGEAPEPFKYNEDWECERCPWLMICNERAKASAV